MTTADIVVLLGLGLVCYLYVGFPLLALFIAHRKSHVTREPQKSPIALPSVSVIIPAYNEAGSIRNRLENLLAADYPRSLLDVIVVSDASTDGTNDIVSQYLDRGVRLIVQEVRRGKSAGLNRAVATATGDIVVFTDANVTYPPETIRHLVRGFDAPQTGLVSGRTLYRGAGSGREASLEDAISAYSRLERAVRRAESTFGFSTGADGAIFAMRRHLFVPLRDDDINDVVLPLVLVERGYQCVMVDDAVCFEDPSITFAGEYQRQARITNRTLLAIWRHRRLLNPIRYPAFAFVLFSRKLMRYLSPLALGAAIVAAVFFATRDWVRLWTLIAITVAAVLVLIGRWNRPRREIGRRLAQLGHLVETFCVVNVAIIVGWVRFLTGHTQPTWDHTRDAVLSAKSTSTQKV
jgi:cellulose synthase/poly-beta-1,6-N-acetylglucosamine synthase-like glycosyltransferase